MAVEDKRGAVLQAMMELITEHGFHGTAMSMVAKRAGVAAGTIYHYFESKEEVINQLYGEVMQRVGLALVQEDSNKGSIKDRFFRYYTNIYHYYIQHPDEFRFLEQYTNSPYTSQLAREENGKAFEPVLLFLQQGIELGVLRPLELRMMMALVHGHVISLAKLHLSDNNLPVTQEQLEQAAQSCWDGVRIN
ncbi:TetR/AcrR family transcriptional regulator [Cesiribacter sp. SM1]|uniref:TetR/AcrR family transcriptional regulator n=1 Tax=Cesiribacter sp. SM1 TaxID=2861196 RepID=UPI001CD5A9EB|nr:TetR/AcrR family transcriptional regulator [Cesiribacter sp. SM1]